MFSQRKIRRRRRGATGIQYALVAAVIAVVVIASIQLLGTASNESLEETSTGVADPSNLVQMID